MAKIFLSYARQDGEFTLKLAIRLKDAGVEIWIDQLDIPAGERWDRAIQQSLESCKALLLVLSPASVDSENVMDEVGFAAEERKLIVPVLFQSCKIPFRLRRLQFIDFLSSPERGFEKLVKTLSSFRAEIPDHKVTPLAGLTSETHPSIPLATELPGVRPSDSHVAVISPLVRRRAQQHNIDLSQMTGTGFGGRITIQDIDAYLLSRG